MNRTNSNSRTLAEWLEWLEDLHPQEIELGLERIHEVIARAALNRQLPVLITVGGTNGKGSVVEYLGGSYFAGGYRTGSYTSPHLHEFNERVRINGVDASDKLLCDAFAHIEAARGTISLTYFEFTTLVAMHVFIDQQVDVAILEVGLGGRLDAVNAWDTDCAVITSIGIDHEAWLGSDRETIGFEKAGIARPNRALVVGEEDCPASINTHASAIGASMYLLGEDFHAETVAGATSSDGSFVCHLPGDRQITLPKPGLAGAHQLNNASVAATTLHLMNDVLALSQDAIAAGIRGARVPGRMQLIQVDGRDCILDVAHNPAAAERLAATLAERFPAQSFVAVVALMQDKDLDGVLTPFETLVEHWLCPGLEVDRALPPNETAARLKLNYAPEQVTTSADVGSALDQALGSPALSGYPVLVFGSFFTVADALLHLNSAY